jgi:hypothetical protein
MGKKTPKTPDPMQTAQAQMQMNLQTAQQQQKLNMVNQVTPDGSLTYAADPNSPGGYTATTALAPGQQGIYNTNQQTQANIAGIGRDQSARIGSLLGTPMKLGNEATEARLMELGMSRLTPQFARDDETRRTKLLNSGIREGSDAWATEMGRLDQSKNDAINQLLLSGRGLANQEIMAERNQPINEITALMSGSQVDNPNFQSTPQAQVGGVNYTGLVSDNYKAQTAQNNAAMGGMFGMGGAIGGAALKYGLPLMMSDRRAKTDIETVGKLDNGLPVYRFRYKDGGPMQIGLMADDVEGIHPEAVVMGGDGFKRVNYAQAVR